MVAVSLLSLLYCTKLRCIISVFYNESIDIFFQVSISHVLLSFFCTCSHISVLLPSQLIVIAVQVALLYSSVINSCYSSVILVSVFIAVVIYRHFVYGVMYVSGPLLIHLLLWFLRVDTVHMPFQFVLLLYGTDCLLMWYLYLLLSIKNSFKNVDLT